jgi:surface polysaccharide O-acyltransferase-like enzyme
VVTNRQLSLDVARVAAITSVILLHASPTPYALVVDQTYAMTWFTWDVFSSLAWFGVPLFVMISGAVLLKPSKVNEPLGVFFKKRWKRIGLPLIFWGAVYFVWSVFVNHTALSTDFVLTSILNGPYFHFWYVYMLVGLYIATPVLRVLVANMTRKVFTYLIFLWFASPILEPFLHLQGQTNADYFFVFTGFLGCYFLGAYLRDVKLRSPVPYGLLALGIGWTIVGNYLITATFGERFNTFILGSITTNTIVTAAALFLILTRITYTNPLFTFVSQNTLTIYLFHVMILEAFTNGYFGFVISSSYINLAAEIPLMTVATLLVTTLFIVPMKKVPLLNKLVG